MDLSQSLRVALAKRHKNQTGLARELGVSNSYINSLCTGKRKMGCKTGEKMAEHLGFKFSEFVSFSEGS